MQLVARAADLKLVIDRHLERVAVEILIVDLGPCTDTTAARLDAGGIGVTVLVDQQLCLLVEENLRRRRGGREQRRHREAAGIGQIGDVEFVTRLSDERQRLIGGARRLEVELAELEADRGIFAGDPRAIERQDALLGALTRGNRIGIEQTDARAVALALGSAQADVEQQVFRRRPGELAEVFVADALVIFDRAVGRGRVIAGDFRTVVRSVEKQRVLDDRPTETGIDPALVERILGDTAHLGDHALRLNLVFDRPLELVGARLRSRVDRETASAIEADGLDAAALHRHVRHVVGRGVGREVAEQGQRHVHAVEAVLVVDARATGRGTEHGVFGVLHTRHQLEQIAVALADGQALDVLGAERITERSVALA